MPLFFSRTARICSTQFQTVTNSLGQSRLPLQTCRSFGKYAKYEKPAHPRLQFNKHFYGWKKYVVIAYNIGAFKLLKWGIIGYVVHKYWHFFWPLIKYGAIITATSFVVLYWLRMGIYRTFGAAKYEKQHFKLCSSRFETIFKEYDQLSTPSLTYLVGKTWLKCMIFRNHRKWIQSLQSFLDGYKPFKYYVGDDIKHGISFQPLLIDHNGYFKGYFTWFIDRKDTMNTYGWVEIKCDGNLSARTMNINEFRLHVNPREGGEVLKFNPIRIAIDDKWNAELLEEIFGYDESVKDSREEETVKSVKKDMPRQKLYNKQRSSPIYRSKKPSKVVDADYKIKN